jgi:hypothetical protein
MGKLKQEARRQRQKELLLLFNQPEDYYEEKEIKDKVYVKQYNGNTKKWQVAEYSLDSFRRYKMWDRDKEIDEELNNRIAREP